MRTVRRLVAPLIGCTLILVLLPAMFPRILTIRYAGRSPAGLCMAEIRKTHRLPASVLMGIYPSNDGGKQVSFGFREATTGQSWRCQCSFDKSGKLISATAVADNQ